MHRYPEGVEGPGFWQKACPEHRPEWVPTAPVWSRDKQANIDYCVVNQLAALLWAVNLAASSCTPRCTFATISTARPSCVRPGPR
jgi:bifunctional non-homologous end joining protein LigD